jgi:hypothetical protein
MVTDFPYAAEKLKVAWLFPDLPSVTLKLPDYSMSLSAHKMTHLKDEVDVYRDAINTASHYLILLQTKAHSLFMAGVSVNNEKEFVFLALFCTGEKFLNRCKITSTVNHSVSWVISNVPVGAL